MTQKLLTTALLAAAFATTAGTQPNPSHPRLGVNAGLLRQIQVLRIENSPEWQRFADWLDKAKVGRADYVDYGGEETSALFGYVVTHDPAFFDISFRILAPKVWRDPSRPSRGVRPYFGQCPDAVFCDDHNASTGGFLIFQIALLYDWGYDRLSPDRRADLIDWMNAAVEFNETKSPWTHAHFRNDGAAILLGAAAVAYATEGENPKAAQQMSWFRDGWKQTLDALDIMGMGGALAEGNAYGETTAGALITLANFVYYDTGEDLFKTHPWFQRRLAYEAFTVYPNPPQDPKEDLEGAPAGGDDVHGGLNWHTIQMRPAGLALARRFPGTEEAAIWNWVFRQPAVDHGYDAWTDLYLYSPAPKLQKPARLSWFDPSMGYIYIRSDWNSPDATWISFWAGPHLDIHQHLDQGAFTLFKRRDLAIKSGSYDGGPNSPHSLAYYTRTISSNGLLIGDPKEYFAGFVAFIGCGDNRQPSLIRVPFTREEVCPPNDGGERTAYPRSMTLFHVAEFTENKNDYDYARVTAFRDMGDTVVWSADITNAYTNPRYAAPGLQPKVTRVWRRFVYLRKEDLLLVADQVTSTDENFRKSWLIHATDHIDAGSNQATIVVDDHDPSSRGETSVDLRKGYAQLSVTTLLPRDVTYQLIGGRQAAQTEHPAADGNGVERFHFHRHLKDFWVEDYSAGTPLHVSANWPPTYPAELARADMVPTYSGGYGRWRLAVEPKHAAKEDVFLNLLEPSLKPSAPRATAVAFQTATTFGAAITVGSHHRTVTFPKASLGLPSVN